MKITEKTISSPTIAVNKPVDKINNNLSNVDNPVDKVSTTNKIEVYSNIKEIQDIIKNGKIDTLDSIESSLFIKNLEPTAKYLMETRLKYIAQSKYYGSDYFLEKVNYKEKKDKYDRVQRLGDAFYENQLVERSIIEKLGTRFLNGEAISMKQLIDNAESEAKNLNLTIGQALTKEQISKLNKDIVWYEYQDVSEMKVLVPKVYLSKNTLANIKADGRSRIEGTELTSIKAKDVDNAGVIGNKGTTYIEADSITNRSIGDQIAEITGDKTSLVAENDIFNIGSKISATDELNLISKNGNILNQSTITETNRNYGDLNRTRHTELENIAEISSNNKLNIIADNYTSIAAKTNAKDLDIAVKEDVNISSQKLSGEQKFGKAGSNFNAYAFESNIGSNVNAENINIDAKNLNITGSDLIAENNININTKEDVNVVSTTDNVYTKSQSKSKGTFSKKSSIDIKYSTENKASNIIGNNINIESGKDVAILGSNIQTGTEGEANISAQGDITQAGVKEIDYSYSKTSKSRFGGLISKSTTKESMQESAIKSATIAGSKGLVYDSKNDLLLEGVNVVSTGNIKIKGNNVVINLMKS